MKKRWLYILLGIVAFLLVLGVGAVIGGVVVRATMKDEMVRPSVVITTSEYGDEEDGVLISKVEVESPADRAGLVRGDILLEMNGKSVDTIPDLHIELAKLNPGETVSLLAMHGDEKLELSATLGERDGIAYLGIQSGEGAFPSRVIARTPLEFSERFVFPQVPGPIVIEPHIIGPSWDEIPEDVDQAVIVGVVLPDTPAEEAGLQDGDFITELDGKPVSKPDAFTKAIQAYKPGEQITLIVYRQGEDNRLEIQATLTEHPKKSGKGYLGIELEGYFQRD